MKWFEAALCRLEDWLHVIGCGALVLIAVLINADIISRLLFRAPIQFQFELVEFYLMPAVATLSLSRAFREGEHLAVEFVQPETFGRLWPFVRIAMLIAAAGFFALVTVMSGLFAMRALLHDDVYFGIIDWPLGWAYASVPLGCAVLTVRLLFDTTRRGAESAPVHT